MMTKLSKLYQEAADILLAGFTTIEKAHVIILKANKLNGFTDPYECGTTKHIERITDELMDLSRAMGYLAKVRSRF